MQLRMEIRTLNKKCKQGGTNEKEGIKNLTTELWGQLCRLRAQRSQRLKKEEAQRTQLINDPYRFTKIDGSGLPGKFNVQDCDAL